MSHVAAEGPGLSWEAAGHASARGIHKQYSLQVAQSQDSNLVNCCLWFVSPWLLSVPWASVSSLAKGNHDLFYVWVSGNFWFM